jgi:amino acid transporter
MRKNFKNLILGNTSSNEQLKSEKLSRLWGLPIMSSDAVSSVAYAVEEILMTLVPAIGLLAVSFVGLVSLPIILLLMFLVFSYSQIINHYPNGGGSYIVSKDNFGRKSSLLAASCLVIDYIMTVAVSVSSSTSAIIAAFPVMGDYRVIIAVVCVGLITLINLRGTSESARIFGIPTYIFIISMAILIISGFFKLVTGNLQPMSYTQEQLSSIIPTDILPQITLMIFLRAFSSGCSALTGVEAVSNAIPSFKSPPQKTAKHVLFMLAAIIVFIFGGTSVLASVTSVIPIPGETVISQMSNQIFGIGFMFYLIQISTAVILLLAANTAYNGLPNLLAILAKDKFMPHQFSQRGAKLSFSNGIMFIFIVSAVLLIIFKADTHHLIPFYSVGVFVSFTISQAGMFIKWHKSKDKGWKHKSIINGVGALITLVCTVVVFITKFTVGAWALVIVIPLVMFFMLKTHKHYELFNKQLSIEGYNYVYEPSKCKSDTPVILLVHNMNKSTIKLIHYSQKISSNITAVHISTTPRHTQKLEEQWRDMNIGIKLEILPAPYRNILEPLEEYVLGRESELRSGEDLTVILTKFVGSGLKNAIFHNQTAFFIESKLGKHKNVAIILVPYILQGDKNSD